MTLKIDKTAKISKLCDIEDSVRGSVIEIGANSVIDSFVKIKPAGGSGDLVIGKSCVINSGCVMYTGNGITIGDYVAVAANCTFAPVNHAFDKKDVRIMEQGFKAGKGGIKIGSDVWIGANCVILDGAVIPDGCVIGASSLVKGELVTYGVYAGSPLEKIGERS